jgi:hypothetical protein
LAEPKAFHESLDLMLAKPDLAREMASRGSKVAEKYSIHALAGQTKGIYEQLIEEKQCAM